MKKFENIKEFWFRFCNLNENLEILDSVTQDIQPDSFKNLKKFHTLRVLILISCDLGEFLVE